MMDIRARANIGIIFLEECVLDVLRVAADTDTPQLRPAEISRRLGIEPTSPRLALSYAIVHGVLDKLLRENRVAYVESNQSWIIAPEEI